MPFTEGLLELMTGIMLIGAGFCAGWHWRDGSRMLAAMFGVMCVLLLVVLLIQP